MHSVTIAQAGTKFRPDFPGKFGVIIMCLQLTGHTLRPLQQRKL